MIGILTLPIAEVVAVGVLLGIVGALAIVGKRVFFSESLSHGTFPGAVLGVVGVRSSRGEHRKPANKNVALCWCRTVLHPTGVADAIPGQPGGDFPHRRRRDRADGGLRAGRVSAALVPTAAAQSGGVPHRIPPGRIPHGCAVGRSHSSARGNSIGDLRPPPGILLF